MYQSLFNKSSNTMICFIRLNDIGHFFGAMQLIFMSRADVQVASPVASHTSTEVTVCSKFRFAEMFRAPLSIGQ